MILSKLHLENFKKPRKRQKQAGRPKRPPPRRAFEPLLGMGSDEPVAELP